MTANLNVEKSYTDPKTGKFIEGNPGGGRPKGSVSVVSKIKAKLKKIPQGKKQSYLTMLVERIFTKAIDDGDEQMIKLICQYVDGMPKQSTDLTSDGKPINVIDWSTYVSQKNKDGE